MHLSYFLCAVAKKSHFRRAPAAREGESVNRSTDGFTEYVLICELRRIGWPADKWAISAPISAAI
jgi:hypothetical protein